MPATLNYLTTLDLDDDWLDALVAACPGLSVRRVAVSTADEVSPAVWSEVDVLHTSTVFPSLDQAPRLRWVQLDTSGVEHVMTEPIWSSDVVITTLGGIAPVPMAEFVTMSLLALAHHQPALDAIRLSRAWPTPDERLSQLTPLKVDGATACIVGYGRIGREVARLLQPMGMTVVGIRRSGVDDPGQPPLHFDTGRTRDGLEPVEVRPVSDLTAVLPRTDFLVVIVPRTGATAGLVGARELALLRPGACVVNVSRAGVVDETALLAALRSRQLRYAALDVFDDEPLPADSPWWDQPHTIVSPHVAGLAPRYLEHVLELVSTNVGRFQAGRPLLNRADRAAGY